MSTRSTTHFHWGDKPEPVAIIYRHSDGYPEAAGVDIFKFLKIVKEEVDDTRFSDPSYLAAKYVVFLADKFNHGYEMVNGELKEVRHDSKFDFLSVGIMNEDPSDIEYRYHVRCGSGIPEVTCEKVNWGETGPVNLTPFKEQVFEAA